MPSPMPSLRRALPLLLLLAALAAAYAFGLHRALTWAGLAARQQQMEQAIPAPAADSSAPLPVGDMPAPSASVLSAPVDGTPIPGNDDPAAASSIPGGQP